MFCDANPTIAVGLEPWDTVLTAYKRYVQTHFGLDTAKHISAAFCRTKLKIPGTLIEKHIREMVVGEQQPRRD